MKLDSPHLNGSMEKCPIMELHKNICQIIAASKIFYIFPGFPVKKLVRVAGIGEEIMKPRPNHKLMLDVPEGVGRYCDLSHYYSGNITMRNVSAKCTIPQENKTICFRLSRGSLIYVCYVKMRQPCCYFQIKFYSN